MNIVFMGTPEFSVPTLENLKKNNHEISLVVTQPDRPKGRGKKLSPSPVKIKAKSMGVEVFQPENINTSESIEKIKSYNPDVIVVIAYGQILKEDVLNIPRFGCINVHASLLPKLRGAGPINWAIINGHTKTGVTTMLMEKGLDSGDMILKNSIDIDDNITAGELHDKLMYLGADLLIDTLNEIENNSIKAVKQEHDKATYAPMLDKKTGEIQWNKEKEKIKNLVRGTNPWPSAYSYYKNKKFKIHEVQITNDIYEGDYGEIIHVSKDGIIIKAKNGSVIIKNIQFPGKRAMDIKDFIKGNNIEKGIILGK